jgi:putative permease
MVVIFPVVVAKIVDLHPVIVVVSVILGSQLFGVLGMIVAVPLTSILKIFIQEIYTRVYDNVKPIQ